MKIPNRFCIVVVCVAFTVLAGCNKGEPKKTSTQVAAKVNSTEITISQINNVLARAPNIKPENVERAKREILDKLIDAELAKEEAIAKKLDRSPAVVQSLEASKTEILARAYLEQFSSQQPKPTADEVKKYYQEHPEFFTQRRVFNVEEIALPASPGLLAKLREQAVKTPSMPALVTWLKSQGIEYKVNSGVRSTEQIPVDYVGEMQAMKDGEIRVIENAGAVLVVRVVASKPAPVDEAYAAPRIQAYLFNQRSTAALMTDMKQLKEKAKIEYVGEFAASAADADAKAKSDSAAREKAATDAKAKADNDARANADQTAAARAAAEARTKAEAETQAQADERARARRAAEAKAREEAEAARAAAPAKPAQPRPEIEKGVSGLIK